MICAQQIAHERRVVREAPVRVLVESQIQRRRSSIAYVLEILFEVAPDKAATLPLAAQATRTGDRYRVRVEEESLYASLDQLRAVGAKILSVTQMKASLEEFFMDLVAADRAQAAAVEVSGK